MTVLLICVLMLFSIPLVFAETTEFPIVVTNPRLTNVFGDLIIETNYGTQVSTTADLQNISDNEIPFTYYRNIENDDTKEKLSPAWITGVLSVNQTFSPSLHWIPSRMGDYTITISVFNNPSEKKLLAETLFYKVFVGGGDFKVYTDKKHYNMDESIIITGQSKNGLNIPDSDMITMNVTTIEEHGKNKKTLVESIDIPIINNAFSYTIDTHYIEWKKHHGPIKISVHHNNHQASIQVYQSSYPGELTLEYLYDILGLVAELVYQVEAEQKEINLLMDRIERLETLHNDDPNNPPAPEDIIICGMPKSFYNPINGTDGDDIITGTNKPDLIYAGAGNDIISTHQGNDCIFGESGNNIIFAGLGDDEIDGGSGNNTKIDGGAGIDICKNAEQMRNCEIFP